MHLEKLTETVELPEGVSATVDGFTIAIKGPKGELSRTLTTKRIHISVEGNIVTFSATNATRRDKRVLVAAAAHVRNMAKGVVEGHLYKLKICSGHFPMSVSVNNGVLEVKNFIGEAVPRRLTLKQGCDVQVKGQDITVESTSKELAGNQAGEIELLTRRPGFDSRIFQDGIYITEKDGREI